MSHEPYVDWASRMDRLADGRVDPHVNLLSCGISFCRLQENNGLRISHSDREGYKPR
jgi:hypothetical protein